MGYLGLHFRRERRLPQYAMGYGLYLLLAVLLAGGWVATRMTERHLYTALGMFIYIASPWIWQSGSFSFSIVFKKNVIFS